MNNFQFEYKMRKIGSLEYFTGPDGGNYRKLVIGVGFGAKKAPNAAVVIGIAPHERFSSATFTAMHLYVEPLLERFLNGLVELQGRCKTKEIYGRRVPGVWEFVQGFNHTMREIRKLTVGISETSTVNTKTGNLLYQVNQIRSHLDPKIRDLLIHDPKINNALLDCDADTPHDIEYPIVAALGYGLEGARIGLQTLEVEEIADRLGMDDNSSKQSNRRGYNWRFARSRRR